MVNSLNSQVKGILKEEHELLCNKILSKNYDELKVNKAFVFIEPLLRHEEACRISFAMTHTLLALDCDLDTLLASLFFYGVHENYLLAEKIEENFGKACLRLILGVQKMEVLSYKDHDSADEKYLETLRKMLLAMVDDARVVLIKLAERLCIMRAMPQSLQSESQHIS